MAMHNHRIVEEDSHKEAAPLAISTGTVPRQEDKEARGIANNPRDNVSLPATQMQWTRQQQHGRPIPTAKRKNTTKLGGASSVANKATSLDSAQQRKTGRTPSHDPCQTTDRPRSKKL